MDVLTPVHFGTVQSNIDISDSAEISMCQNVHVPQCPSLVRSPCRNIHGAKKYPCTNVLAQIIPCLSYCPAGIMVISMRNTRVKQFL